MNKNQLLALAAFITSLANEGDTATCSEPNTPETPAPRKPRGRPPGTATPPATETAGTAEPEKTQEPEKPATPERSAEDIEADYQKLRAIIKPHVEANRGAEVKKEIAKFAADLKTLATLPQHHAEFAKNVEALAY